MPRCASDWQAGYGRKCRKTSWLTYQTAAFRYELFKVCTGKLPSVSKRAMTMPHNLLAGLSNSCKFLIMMEGEAAAFDGLPASSNPYDVGSEEEARWLAGWMEAQEQGKEGYLDSRGYPRRMQC